MREGLTESDNLYKPPHPLTSTKVEPKRYVVKRSGERVAVNEEKVLQAITACAYGLEYVSPQRVADKTMHGLCNGSTTRELHQLAIHAASNLTFEEPEYSKLAARMLNHFIKKEGASVGVTTFRDSIEVGYRDELINDRLYQFVREYGDKIEALIDYSRDDLFEFFGLQTIYTRYLLRHRTLRFPIELPQHFFMRIACALSRTFEEVEPFYNILSNLDYLPSSPTLFNAGTLHEQLSSCFLVDSPKDDLESIYSRYTQIALLSKFSGGIGIAYHRVRSHGSLIRGTNGRSAGIIPWLKTLDASVAAVNQGGRRKGAACVYLESWHADIEDFLELRDNTGSEARRTHNLNIANWVSDLFMERVHKEEDWSLFDPKDVPELPDLYGDAFRAAYLRAEAAGLAKKTIPALTLFKRMMLTLARTGNGWMTFKDRCNQTCNQTNDQLFTDPAETHRNRVVHVSNLCTEIVEISSNEQTSVCNLGSVNLSHHICYDEDGKPFVDYQKLANTVKTAVRHLDRVIDLNFYPIPEAEASNFKWRPIGIGMMGLQDVFFKMRLAFDSDEAREISRRVAEEVYFNALKTSCELAKEFGCHQHFEETRVAKGEFQFDYWETKPVSMERWDKLREEIKAYGLRNSLVCAIAPTATIASIAGCYECIEPQVSNLFKRETMSGDFMQVNRYLVADLKELGIWNQEFRDALILSNGSVQGIQNLSPELRMMYRTVWEMKMKPIIDMAAERGAFIDQSQSLNLFAETPDIGTLCKMYYYAWKSGIKTCYYLRSRPATRIAPTTVSAVSQRGCSLENPEYCEACQ